MLPELARYLEELSVNLHINPVRERQVLREMYTHLEERVSELESEGLSKPKAVELATQTFGRPEAVASEIEEVHNRGSWNDALLAAAPYVFVALLFGLHLWQSIAWLAFFLTISVATTLVGWWRGKPLWMYPWAGFSLVLPLFSGMIAGSAVRDAATNFSHGKDVALPLWVIIGLIIYIPLSVWMLVSVAIKVIKFDWIFASLMLLPFPILVRWLLSLQVDGRALVYNKPFFTSSADAIVATVFLTLALLPVLFVRLGQRRWKILALIIATPPAFLVAAYNTPGYAGLPGLILLAVISVLFLLTPALLDLKVGRRSARHRASVDQWAESLG